MYTFAHIYTHIYIYTRMYLYIYIYTHIYTKKCICIRVCIHAYTQGTLHDRERFRDVASSKHVYVYMHTRIQ